MAIYYTAGGGWGRVVLVVNFIFVSGVRECKIKLQGLFIEIFEY